MRDDIGGVMITCPRSKFHGVRLSWTLVLALSLWHTIPTFAQVAGATLQGTVTDESGSTVSTANVSVINTATGITRGTTTDSSGFYSVPNLAPSIYDVTISAQGFSTTVQKA